jgi:hypothetical protein
MSMSTEIVHKTPESERRAISKAEMIGLCLNCGVRITLCGKPFTADIPCCKCLYINVFQESRQPVSGHW